MSRTAADIHTNAPQSREFCANKLTCTLLVNPAPACPTTQLLPVTPGLAVFGKIILGSFSLHAKKGGGGGGFSTAQLKLELYSLEKRKGTPISARS